LDAARLDLRGATDEGSADEAEGTPTPTSRLRERREGEGPPTTPGHLRRDTTPHSRRGWATVISVSGQPLVRGGYEGMRCAGCGEQFGARGVAVGITPGGVGMIHNTLSCLHAARPAMADEAARADRRDSECEEREAVGDAPASAAMTRAGDGEGPSTECAKQPSPR